MQNQLSDYGRMSFVVQQGSILRPLLLCSSLFMSQVVHSNLFLYVEGSCLTFQHKNVKEIETALNNDFENICDWFVDSKLSFHFNKDKIIVIRNRKPSQRKIKIIKRLNKKYK